MDEGAWWATAHRVTKSQTLLKWLNTHIESYYLFSPGGSKGETYKLGGI